ncbi:hypothetical protein CHS0354_015444 [Potamilus streckersoni]|uniref:Uncharacterized protein n=1 Tax=Potamilus streckersoni TaxID=2493646 RepID=A0AAE0SMI2_9BIVA|nr:hypothetical protein CHS0354_015444 [Potamilus streckersoni]
MHGSHFLCRSYQDPYRTGYDQRNAQYSNQGTIQTQTTANETTVIISQSGRMPMVHVSRNWSSDICACTNDMQSCLLVCLCPQFYGCYLSGEMDENICLPLWHPFFLTSLRSKLRMQRNIQGDICCDHCATTWLPFCVMCQIKRELKAVREEEGDLNTL